MVVADSSHDASSGADSPLMRIPGLDSKLADCYTTSSGSGDGLSLIYTALPRMFQQRLPQIRSLRRAASIYASPRAHLRSWSTSSDMSTYSDSPPPSYHTEPSTLESSADEGRDGDSDDETPKFFSSAPSSRPSTSGYVTPAPAHLAYKRHEETYTPSFGNRSSQKGLELLNDSMRSRPGQTPEDDDLNRRLYIDGISYVLRGLPTDLTSDEALTIRTAVPASILPPPREESAVIHQPTKRPPQPTEPPTLLRRAVSTTTFYTLLALTLLIPHIQTLFATLCALDARHNISRRFLTQTNFLLRILAAQAVAVLAMAWGANDGALRHACRDFGVWVLRDVCGGMDEGVGRAVVNLRLEEKEARK
ncbi:hypothetical protein Q7P35_005310 [Cladosporium inversicolor]